MTVTWSGMGERHEAGYDKMTLKVDGVEVASAAAPGGGLLCPGGVGPVISTPEPPYVAVLEGGLQHTIRIETTTGDENYHIGAYYQFEISFD